MKSNVCATRVQVGLQMVSGQSFLSQMMAESVKALTF